MAPTTTIDRQEVLVIYVDGIIEESVTNLGENVSATYFRYERIDGVTQKVPVMEIIRPKSSTLVRNGALARFANMQPDPRQVGVLAEVPKVLHA